MLENLQQTFYGKCYAHRIVTAQLTTLGKISWYSSLEMSFLMTHDKSALHEGILWVDGHNTPTTGISLPDVDVVNVSC